jgi:hypothetical protein
VCIFPNQSSVASLCTVSRLSRQGMLQYAWLRVCRRRRLDGWQGRLRRY